MDQIGLYYADLVRKLLARGQLAYIVLLSPASSPYCSMELKLLNGAGTNKCFTTQSQKYAFNYMKQV